MDTIGANLQAVKARIAAAATQCGRVPDSIELLAVSKTFSATAVRSAHAAGQRAFGENYVQEAIDKINALRNLPLVWHFIGPIQSNKTREIAVHFDWAHSIDRLKIAERLAAARPVDMAPLQVCVQINIGNEDSKSGIAPAAAPALLREIATLPRLKLRGLMTIPPASEDIAVQRGYFAQLRRVRDDLAATGILLDTLSMGMSADIEAAIAEGATTVRVGTAIFGVRHQQRV
jgi:pyridoxal phosphate enzyme (YggS family)